MKQETRTLVLLLVSLNNQKHRSSHFVLENTEDILHTLLFLNILDLRALGRDHRNV